MGTNGSRARWVAAGLCVDCGRVRAVDVRSGKVRSRCERCLAQCRVATRTYRGRRTEDERAEALEKMRARHRGRREGWQAQGRCVRCGRERTAGSGFLTCARCLQRLRSWCGKRRQERWGNFGPAPEAAWAWSLGRHVPRLQNPKMVSVRLPEHQMRMLETCYQQFRAREAAGGGPRRSHARSLAVREVIAGFARRDCPLPPGRQSAFKVQRVPLYLDEPSRAIVADQARRRFGGNFSACLRAMIQETAQPRFIGQVVRCRWDPWRDEP